MLHSWAIVEYVHSQIWLVKDSWAIQKRPGAVPPMSLNFSSLVNRRIVEVSLLKIVNPAQKTMSQ